MGKLRQKGIMMLLVAALCFSGIAVPAKQTKAANDAYEIYLDGRYAAVAGAKLELPEFTAKNKNPLTFAVFTTARTDFDVVLSVNGTARFSLSVLSTDSNWYYAADEREYYKVLRISEVTAGAVYSLSVTFPENTNFDIRAYQEKVNAYMKYSSVMVTKGYKMTLSVVNNTELLTWTSSNSGIASVAQNGVVTGKKKGTAVITAKTASGKIYTCTVSVKNNVYSKPKKNIIDTIYGQAYLFVNKISYDKKGNIVIKVFYLNNSGHKIIRLKNVQIKVKNKNGKLIGTYKLKSKKITIYQKGTKNFTYKIKKSKLKIKKKQDLRLASAVPKWIYIYTL